MSERQRVPLLRVRDIAKSFPGVQALRGVSLYLAAGEVLAVVGENGAGKSTLMKILAGVQRPDDGEIRLDGKPVVLESVHDAEAAGIVLIHQELSLAENLDVAGNLFLGREATWGGPLKLLDRRMYADARAILDRVGLEVSPRALVAELSVGQQQLVEIARALSLESRVLIMDEPTSSLTQHETDRLYQVVRELKRNGVSVLYISHRLNEVRELADRVTVLRDGRNAGELQKVEISHESLVRLMVGRELKQFFQRSPHTGKPPAEQPLLRAKGLRIVNQRSRPISFDLHAGEIVGIAGLVGAGRTELAEALFGVRPLAAGKVELEGRPLTIRSPQDAIGAGIYLVPEDRRHQGLVLSGSVGQNISLPSLRRLSRFRIVSRGREQSTGEEMKRQLNIRTPTLAQIVGLLSGGNQQKVVLGKWLCRQPRVLILDEPTRGVDVGAKSEIYAIMDRLAGEGVGILMISSDLEEILGMSDRVLVMHEGRLAGELPRGELSEERVMHLATGGSKPPAEPH